jgi:hypothetical protein
MSTFRLLRASLALGLVALLGACAHPLSLDPLKTPPRDEAGLVAKKVGYVMTDADRAKQVTTPGGGGDQVSYFPYRDMEKPIREALRSVYQDVTSVPAAGEVAARAAGVAYVFAPQITTTSSSPSALTWPPTKFSAEISCTVTDAQGALVAQFRVSGDGVAEFDEFKSDHSLSARRSVIQVAEKFAQAVRENPKLK